MTWHFVEHLATMLVWLSVLKWSLLIHMWCECKFSQASNFFWPLVKFVPVSICYTEVCKQMQLQNMNNILSNVLRLAYCHSFKKKTVGLNCLTNKLNCFLFYSNGRSNEPILYYKYECSPFVCNCLQLNLQLNFTKNNCLFYTNFIFLSSRNNCYSCLAVVWR